MNNWNLVIIIPCYNEGKYFKHKDFINFLELNKLIKILFVNDGSKDKTLNRIKALQTIIPNQVEYISYATNKGKAEAIRTGVMYTSQNLNTKQVAYLDADLATPLEECLRLSSYVSEPINFVLATRLSSGANIQRNVFRSIIGKITSTAISFALNLKMYDTQCGCKVFCASNSTLFQEPFISRWLFDVELLFRLIKQYGKEQFKNHVQEVPLNHWKEMDDSKVPLSYGFTLWFDLFNIYKHYRKH